MGPLSMATSASWARELAPEQAQEQDLASTVASADVKQSYCGSPACLLSF